MKHPVHLSYFRLCGVPLSARLSLALLSQRMEVFKIIEKFSGKVLFSQKGFLGWVRILSGSLLIVQSMIYLYEKFVTPAAFLLISDIFTFGKYSAPVSIILLDL